MLDARESLVVQPEIRVVVTQDPRGTGAVCVCAPTSQTAGSICGFGNTSNMLTAVRLTKMSSVMATLLPFVAVLLPTPPSTGSRKGFFDMLLENGKFCCLASALLGDGEAALERLRKGLLEERLRERPGDGWRSSFVCVVSER